MASTDRPLYEDLLKQRNDLERIANQLIGHLHELQPGSSRLAEEYQAQMDEIIVENRRREGLT